MRGNKPLFYAKSQDFTEIIEMLPSHQEEIDTESYNSNINEYEDMFVNLKPTERYDDNNNNEHDKFHIKLKNKLLGLRFPIAFTEFYMA